MGLKEKIINKEIKLFPVGEAGYRFYGKIADVKDELKEIGAVYNVEQENYEISKDKFSMINKDLREFILKTILQSKVESAKVIANAIKEEKIKLYPKGDFYKVYGKTKEIYKDLLNTGFKLEDKNYQISIKSFNAEFNDDVKEIVNSQTKEINKVCSEEMEG